MRLMFGSCGCLVYVKQRYMVLVAAAGKDMENRLYELVGMAFGVACDFDPSP